MKRILLCCILGLSQVVFLSSGAQANEVSVSGVKFSYSNPVYAPQTVSEFDQLAISYENKSKNEIYSIDFIVSEKGTSGGIYAGAVNGVKPGTIGKIQVDTRAQGPLIAYFGLFLTVPISPIGDYEVSICVRNTLADSKVCTKSNLVIVYDRTKVTIPVQTKDTSSPKPIATPKKTTIACVKGQLTKKVTAVKPKCPAGYKLKK